MMGPDILDLLYPALNDEDPLIRAGIIETIAELKSNVSVQYLINISRDPDPDVRREIARALGKIGGKDAIITLITLLRDQDGRVWSSAAESLLLLHPEATEQLIKILADTDINLRRKSSDTLTSGGLQVVPMLIHATGDNNPDIREGAVKVLGRISSPDAITALMVSLEDHEARVRSEAVTALVRIGELSIKPLTEAIHSDSLPLRNGAMESLSRIGNPAVPPLIALTKDNNPVVRKISCSILGESGDKTAEKALIETLNDEVVSVRREAFESLEVLRSKIHS